MEGPTVPGYEILSELGRGGMGVVYKARQSSLKRLVALKMILGGTHAGEEQLARFRAEAEAVARLQHPNIVQIYEVGEQAGLPFFSLEFIDGGTLKARAARTQMTAREVAQVVETLARAVHAAHERGVVHRDLKPENVLLMRDGTPKITDFGLAKQIGESGTTQTGAVVGTPSYMAPEQATGRISDIGPCTDVYALGAILYDLLTGRPPFRGESPMDTLLLVAWEEPVPPIRLQPKVPPDLETICLKCLHKQSSQRYATALELAEDLRRFLNGEPILARPAGLVERTWRWCRRNPLPSASLAAVSGLLIVVTLAAAFGLWHLSQLSRELVQSTALESAAQQSEMLEGVNDFYSSEVVNRAKTRDLPILPSPDYKNTPGAIPIPASMTIELGNHISASSERGMAVRLYSDYPFLMRKDGGPRDDFERQALIALRKDPETPYYRFEDVQGRPSLRYATARLMKDACVKCHNTHPESTKKDWKTGDVRGVVEIIRPLDHDVKQTQEGLRGTFMLVGIVSGTLLFALAGVIGAAGTFLFVKYRRQPPATSPPAAS